MTIRNLLMSPVRLFRSTFGSLEEGDRNIILYLAFLSTLLLLAFFMLRADFVAIANNPKDKSTIDVPQSAIWVSITVLSAVISSTMVVVCFSIFEKAGLLLPIHRKAEGTLEALDKKVQALETTLGKKVVELEEVMDEKAGQLEKTIGAQSDQLRRALTNWRDYFEYETTKTKFGLAGIAGQKQVGTNGGFETKNIFLDELREAGAGTCIKYMNTFLEHIDFIETALERAVARGVTVQMLIMDPAVTSLTQSRYSDYYHGNYGSLEKFTNHITDTMEWLFRISSNISHAKPGPDDAEAASILRGKLEVRLYTQSLNYPLVAVTGAGHETVYTGFYGSVSSEEMFYVKWTGGEFGAYQKLIEVFDAKWQAAGTHTA